MPRPAQGAFTSSSSSLDAKVEYLRSLCGPGDEIVETHFAWVFLVGDRAWKLRKPVQRDTMDYRTLEARRFDSLEEVRLNRRLAPDVYLGTAPLVLDPRMGQLSIDGAGETVDWLVCMRRLDRSRLLDERLRSSELAPRDLEPVVHLLASFYMGAAPAVLDGHEFVSRMARRLEANSAALRAAGVAGVEPLAREQRAFLERGTALLAARAARGCVVEAHGDLRPEHIFLGDRPSVIDCLEFDRDLRILDRAEELCFLEIECARLGRPATGRFLLRATLTAMGDDVGETLLHFYRSHRATTRAKIYAWRAAEPDGGAPEDWLARARFYVDVALGDARRSLA